LKAVALVAHPDDCVIFAWPFIEAHPEFKWHIVYMTHAEWDPRAKEMQAYWSKRNIPTTFLGYNDDWEYVKNNELGFDGVSASRELAGISDQFDLILTHYEDGDYGHLHHKFVNTAARQNGTPKVYFASTFNYNTECIVQVPVAVDELPLHRSVVEEFTDRNTGRYIVTPEAELLIKNNK